MTYEPLSSADVQRLTEVLRERARAFHDQPEPVRTHLVRVACPCGAGVFASPDSPIAPRCTNCWAIKCGTARPADAQGKD